MVWDNQNPPAGLAALSGSRFDHTVSSYSYTLDYKYTGTRPHAANKITETSSTGSANDHVVNYDANGNNTGNVYMGATRTQTWDEENRLKEVKDATVSRGKFLYSPDGERTQRQTAAGDAFYVNQFFVLQPSGILPTKHIFAGETRIVSKTDPISQVPMISYYHPDHLGSTSYTSASDQSLLQHERYFPFGERDTGDQEECDLGRPDNMRRSWIFNSKELDFDTGLYYFGARYYDPKTSVWQSPDPALHEYVRAEHTGGVQSISFGIHSIYSPRNLGLYSYAWNNPVILTDPDGKRIVFAAGSTSAFKAEYHRAVNYLRAAKASGILSQLQARPEVVTLREGAALSDVYFKGSGINELMWNPYSALRTTSGGKQSPALGLLHEADHALQEFKHPAKKAADIATPAGAYDNLEEKRVIRGSEKQAAVKLGESVRTSHRGHEYHVPHSDRR